DPHSEAVIGEDLEPLRIVGRACARTIELRHHSMYAARVVAEHAAEGAVGVGRGIRTEDQAVTSRFALQRVEYHAWLDMRQPPRRVDAQHAIDVLRHVHDDGDIAALSREARA